MAVELVDNWRQWKKLWSMKWAIVTTFLASVQLAYVALPDDWLPSIPDLVKSLMAYALLTSAGLTGVTRLIKQPKLEEASKYGPTIDQ